MFGLQRFTNTIGTKLFRRAVVYSSSSTVARPVAACTAERGIETVAPKDDVTNETSPGTKKKSTLVAAAFESLKNSDENNTEKSTPTPIDNVINERIINAKTVNGLLAIVDGDKTITRTHAFKIVSILSEWSSINKVKISDFENDSRFLRVCRLLGRHTSKASNVNNTKAISGFRTDDLNTVLGVAGDDEAAKLIASISLPQMVKVMSALASRKRRSTPLLRSLAFNISSSTEQLDLKQCADVFYAMATLNFQDSVLAAKLCSDVLATLKKNTEKSAVVGSILTSLGILKYRDLDILEALTQWILTNQEICRPQDLSALFLTSALLNFRTMDIENVRSKLVKSIVKEDFPKPSDWLNHVWALALLDLINNNHLESVLNSKFLQTLTAKNNLSPTSKMKLLNLNSYAQILANNYKGSLLPADSDIFNVPIVHSKTKTILLNGMLDALKSLLPANNHFNSLVDSKMGFLIDAVCIFDEKRNPLPLNTDNPNSKRVALMVIDYHDLCHGAHRSFNGILFLNFNLLEKSGYKVIPIPHNEFNTSDKLLKRVQYLETKFKTLVSKRAQ
ncbi:FAST kinase domain-containing protein 4 [Teleopsis dalmanni]|uniref:FAST kinase domain-containing protein 4 n=1 Tax=Teleopsis dalmanni TaxID=139649 RepID=UPI0018CE7080|nr:FAST kinase domain-containing protein 4 [Teleopsis dalmanni]